MHDNFEPPPSYNDQVQSPIFNANNYSTSHPLNSSKSPLYPSQQVSQTPKHFDTAYHNLLKKLTEEQHDSNESALIYKLLLTPQHEDNLSKDQLYSKKHQEDSAKRFMSQAVELKAKHNQLAEDMIQKELKECSFNPNILVTAENEPHRSLPEFLASQTKFLNSKSQKIETLRTHLSTQDSKEKTSNPQLCKESLEILKKKAKETHVDNIKPAYERLYSLNKKMKCIEKGESPENSMKGNNDNFFADEKKPDPAENITFIPKINEKSREIVKNQGAVRENNADTRLYDDYFHREKKLKKKQTIRSEDYSNNLPVNPNKTSKTISVKLIAEAFIKEYKEIARNYLILGRDPSFDYLSLCEILKQLGFITNMEKLAGGLFEKERTLLFELWWALKGEEFKGVGSRNLCLFLLGVLGLCYTLEKHEKIDGFSANALPKDDRNKNFDEEKEGVKLTKSLIAGGSNRNVDSHKTLQIDLNENQGKTLALGSIVTNNSEFYEQWAKLKQGRIYGKFDSSSGNLELSKVDIEEIHKKFELFYRNRLSNEVLKKANVPEKPTFEPNILQNSKVMANNYREKMIEKTNDFLKTQSLEGKVLENGGMNHAELLIYSKEARKFEQKKKNDEEKPQKELIECTFHPKILGVAYQSERVADRNIELYTLSKKKTKPQYKDTHSIEYEKYCNECTFQPDLKKAKDVNEQKVYAKNIEKFIQRMRNSQKEREYVNKWKNSEDRGHPGKRQEIDLLEGGSTISKQDHPNSDEKVSIFKEDHGISQEYYEREEGFEGEHNDFNGDNEKVPLLFVDVNIGPNRTERIIVNEGDKSEDLAEKFAKEFSKNS